MIFSSLSFLTVLIFTSADDTNLRKKANLHDHDQRKLRGASFCYEDFDPMGDGCWENRPINLPTCTLEFAVTTPEGGLEGGCFFADPFSRGDVESDNFQDPNFTVAQCESAMYYYREDRTVENVVCREFEIFDQWNELGKVGTAQTDCDDHWWKAACCLFKAGFSLRDGVCSETSKHLDEACGDEWGICKNAADEAPYQHDLSCYQKEGTSEPKCYPSSNDMENKRCECSGISFVVCNSNDCNGHACVLTLSDGNHYCDWGTGNGW